MGGDRYEEGKERYAEAAIDATECGRLLHALLSQAYRQFAFTPMQRHEQRHCPEYVSREFSRQEVGATESAKEFILVGTRLAHIKRHLPLDRVIIMRRVFAPPNKSPRPHAPVPVARCAACPKSSPSCERFLCHQIRDHTSLGSRYGQNRSRVRRCRVEVRC